MEGSSAKCGGDDPARWYWRAGGEWGREAGASFFFGELAGENAAKLGQQRW